MLSKGAELPRPPPTHPEETEEELTETNDMQEDDEGAGLHGYGNSVLKVDCTIVNENPSCKMIIEFE